MRKSIPLLIAIVVVWLAPAVSGQRKPAVDPQDKPRKVKEEPDKAFKQFIIDVGPIISDAERRAWDQLKTNAEREQFIDIFWKTRDPDPDTEENEYREAYYERIAYVNEHFSSGIPGYKTDRGRTYLKYGKPDEVDSHPAGGAYQGDPGEGFGATSTYPFEKWFYRNIPGRAGAEIEFVDPTGTGEYRIANNPFEKIALLNVPGGVETTGGTSQGGLVAASHGIGNPISTRDSDSPG